MNEEISKKPIISPRFLKLSRHLLDIAYPLAKGPNTYKSQFSKVLEGVFRKGYFTLQTIAVLADMVERDSQLRIVFGGSILDLSRRVFEDMIYMEYINESGKKEEYVKQFFDYVDVDRKDDLDFLLKSGVNVDQKIISAVEKDYKKIPSKLKKRKNWAGQSVEQVIAWLIERGKIEELRKADIFKIYTAGNRKNHTSPSDILGHRLQESLELSAEQDIEMGLMITHGSLVKIGLLFAEETETSEEIKKALQECWESINKE